MCGDVVHSGNAVGVGVVRVLGEYRLLAVSPFRPGEFLFQIEGERTANPTRYSVQLDQDTHIDLGGAHDLEEILDRYFWRFMNHSCEPNAVIRGEAVIALRPIRPWEEITFNYNTTEYDMAEPFVCGCGSSECQQTIRGFKHLSPAEQERLRPTLAPYLLCILDGAPIWLNGDPAVSGGASR